MRLHNQHNPSPPSYGNGDVSTPHIVEKMTPTIATRHSRPSSTSSLDYRSPTGQNSKVATTKPMKKKKPQHQINLTPEEQQQQLQQQILARGNPQQRRAQGSAGPPRKWDLTDLGSMTEQEMIRALYEDPDLANQAVKAAELEKSRTGAGSTGPPTGAKKSRGRYYRSSDGSAKDVSEYPDHIRELMDGGVPVMQWIILLVLLGAGLYQLRKSLAVPDKKKAIGGSSAKKGAEKSGKGKQKKTSKKNPETMKIVAHEKTAQTLLEQKKKKSPEPATKNLATPAKKQISKRKQTKSAKTKIKATKKAEKQQPDLISTDGSSGAHHDEGKSGKKQTASSKNPIHTEQKDGDGGGWQTVSKSSRNNAAPQEITKPAKTESHSNQENLAKATPKLVQDSPNANLPVVEETGAAPIKEDQSQLTNGGAGVVVKTLPPPGFDVQAMDIFAKPNLSPPPMSEEKAAEPLAQTNPNKNKKAKIPLTGEAPASETLESTANNDLVYALQLQQEEEKLARTVADHSEEEEVWEEVPSNKRKGK